MAPVRVKTQMKKENRDVCFAMISSARAKLLPPVQLPPAMAGEPRHRWQVDPQLEIYSGKGGPLHATSVAKSQPSPPKKQPRPATATGIPFGWHTVPLLFERCYSPADKHG